MVTSLSQLDPKNTYTYADYLTWKFEERVELLRGFVARLETPNRFHQDISGVLGLKIGNFIWKSTPELYNAPFDVRLPHFSKKKNREVITVVQPDLCVICDPSKLDTKGCIGAPDLMIEILSPGNSKREMKDKFDIYEEAGVKEYWIVFPGERSVQVFQLNEVGKFIGLRPFTEDDTLTTPILPGLAIELMDVFEE